MQLDLLLQRGEGDVVLLPARRLGPTPEGRHLSLVTSQRLKVVLPPSRAKRNKVSPRNVAFVV